MSAVTMSSDAENSVYHRVRLDTERNPTGVRVHHDVAVAIEIAFTRVIALRTQYLKRQQIRTRRHQYLHTVEMLEHKG